MMVMVNFRQDLGTSSVDELLNQYGGGWAKCCSLLCGIPADSAGFGISDHVYVIVVVDRNQLHFRNTVIFQIITL